MFQFDWPVGVQELWPGATGWPPQIAPGDAGPEGSVGPKEHTGRPHILPAPLGPKHPDSCPLGEAGPLPGLWPSPLPREAPPRSRPCYGWASPPRRRHRPHCSQPTVWGERNQAGDRPGVTDIRDPENEGEGATRAPPPPSLTGFCWGRLPQQTPHTTMPVSGRT